MENANSSQMLKGILPGCILLLIGEEALYGYTLSQRLTDFGFREIPKGTIYPLLLSLEKKGFITGQMQDSADGPKRKYYFLTPAGTAEKEKFIRQWQKLSKDVSTLIERTSDTYESK